MTEKSQIKKHMKVIASDGRRVGTVDCVKSGKIILTKSDPMSQGIHHAIPLDWLSSVENEEVRLNQTIDLVRANWIDAENASEAKAVCP